MLQLALAKGVRAAYCVPYFKTASCKPDNTPSLRETIPVLQMRKLKLREVKGQAQGHMAAKWQ